MISGIVAGFSGSSFSAFRVINSRLDSFRESFEKQPATQQDIQYIRENAGKMESLDEFMDDYRLWNATATAFGLGENAFAKGLFKKLMTEDSTKPESLVNRMVDPRYREIAEFFSYDSEGPANFQDADWVNGLVEKFVTRKFENDAGAANPAVRDALYFQRKASEITSYYDILGDERLFEVVRTAANLPASISSADIDRQVELLSRKVDLEDFQNPQQVSKMLDRFLAISDAQSASMGAGTSSKAIALQTFGAPPSTGYAPILAIDPTLFLK